MFSGTWTGAPTRWKRECCDCEYAAEKIPDSRFAALHYYRKAAMFDRLLSFDIATDTPSAIRH